MLKIDSLTPTWWTQLPWWRRALSLTVWICVAVVAAVAWTPTLSGVSYSANTLLTISLITAEAMRVLVNNLTATRLINRNYDDKFAVEGAKVGTTVNVRKPPRYVGRTGQALSVEDAEETQVPVTLTTQFGVDLNFSTADLTLSIDNFSDRFIKPAVATIANKVDYDVLQLYSTVSNSVGTPATVPNAILTYLQAGRALNNEAAPKDGMRSMVISPDMEATIVDALKGLFHQSAGIAEQYREGEMGRVVGFDWFMDQNVATHTVGAFAGTPLVDGASQSGTSLVTDGWTSGSSTLNAGDIFTIADVLAVNPQSRQSTGLVRQFRVVTQISDTSGAKTITIAPGIVASGQGQTVDALPANNAAITVVGAASAVSPQGMAFHRDAFCLAMADLYVPKGTDMAARISDPDLGLSIRLVRDYDINLDRTPTRLDVLYGVATLRSELACRVQS